LPFLSGARMDFSFPSAVVGLRERVRKFIEQEVVPFEKLESDEDGLPAEHVATLHQKARAAELWAPQLPKSLGGLGMEGVGLCALFEEAGRSPLGPLALHCAA